MKDQNKITYQIIDYKLWKIIEYGDFVLRKLIMNNPEDEIEYNNEDKKMLSLNAKAINILFCELHSIEFN